MLKINKCVSLTRRIPQISWFRNYNYEGNCPPRYECKQPEEGEFELREKHIRERMVPPLFRCKPHKDFRIYRNIFFFICVPAILLTYINVFYLNDECEKRPKFVEYTYLRIRNKSYPWDPVRTLFHNPDFNALPTGYETEFPEDREFDPFDRYPCPVPKKL